VTLTVAAHLLNVVKMELRTATAFWVSAVSCSGGQALGMRRRGATESVVVMLLSQTLGWLGFFDEVGDGGIALVLVVLSHLNLVLLKRVAVECFLLL
jgi:hypothetical protein